MRTKIILWYSRHPMTDEQKRDLDGVRVHHLNAATVNTVEEEEEERESIRTCIDCGVESIYGVFPAWLLAKMWGDAQWAIAAGDYVTRPVTCFAAKNSSRSVEGGRPTFTHRGFVPIGAIRS